MFRPDVLAGKSILITGGGTGLGRAMALAFADLGAQVFLVGRREEPLQRTCNDVRASGGHAAWATADVRDFAAVEQAVNKTWSSFGRLDAVVNNAAGNFLARTERLSPNAFAAIVGIVLHGTFHCTLAAGRRWIAAGQPGHVLNILTSYATTGSPFVVPSACAKAGVLALTRSLAVEWARYRIRVNAIAPGPFPTPGAWEQLVPSAEFEQRWQQAIPAGRFGRHEELTALAAFLLSEPADYITGACVAIDGGLTACSPGGFQMLLDAPAEFWQTLEARHRTSRQRAPESDNDAE
jgi:NAD(P)-dependent dehydrogenase (short-subunit alcohol dehydrogenase family)